MKNMIKRIIIGVSIGLIIGFINSCEVHAESFSGNISPQSVLLGNSAYIWNLNLFHGDGDGVLQFSFFTTSGIVREITAETGDGKLFNCIIDSVSNNADGTDIIIYSVSCPMSLGNSYLRKLYMTRGSAQNVQVYMGARLTYTNEFNYKILSAIQSINYNNILNDIYSKLDTGFNDIYNLQVQINNKLNTGFTDLYNALVNNSNLQQQQINEIKETNKQMKETNDFLKDSSLPDNSSSDIGDMNNEIATNGTITNLVTMPITFLQKIINTMDNNCTPVVIGELYDHNFTMPCINPSDYIGMIWNIIDVICCGFLVYKFSMLLVRIFHRVTSLKDGGLEEAYD